MATFDLYKEACRKPKVLNPDKKKANKNKYTTDIGDTKGKVYIQQQDIRTLHVRKYGPKSKRDESKASKEKVEAADV